MTFEVDMTEDDEINILANLKKCKVELCMSKGSIVLIYLTLLFFLKNLLFAKRKIAKTNQNLGTLWHIEESDKKFWGHPQFFQPQMSFDLNDLAADSDKNI